MKPANQNKPAGRQLASTPYGLPPLVRAAEVLVHEHVLSDISALLSDIVLKVPPELGLQKFLVHTGFLDPRDNLGLLDFAYSADNGLGSLEVRLMVQAIEGGNGAPLLMGKTLTEAAFGFDKASMGELVLTGLTGSRDDWIEFMREAAPRFKQLWREGMQAGLGPKISSELGFERAMSQFLRDTWTSEKFSEVLGSLGLEMQLIDDEDDAPEYVSTLELMAHQVHLVTPWLAGELQKRGAMAEVFRGLPLWSRDNSDAPHLEQVVQDIAYDKFGESVDAELSTNQQDKE